MAVTLSEKEEREDVGCGCSIADQSLLQCPHCSPISQLGQDPSHRSRDEIERDVTVSVTLGEGCGLDWGSEATLTVDSIFIFISIF